MAWRQEGFLLITGRSWPTKKRPPTLVQGVEQLLAGNGVDRLAGKGTLLAGKKVRVTTEEKEEVYAADHIILAAGSKPLLLPSREWIFRECSPATDYFVFRNALRAWLSSAAG